MMETAQLAKYTKQDCHGSWSKSSWRYRQGSLHQLGFNVPYRNPLYFQMMK